MKCQLCSREWQGATMYCPACGAPAARRARARIWELIWVAGSVLLLIWVIRSH